MDDDDFDLTMEEMDALEKEALERINQERTNHSSSSQSPNKVLTFSISILWVSNYLSLLCVVIFFQP